MAKIKFENGITVEVEGNPTEEQVLAIWNDLQSQKTPDSDLLPPDVKPQNRFGEILGQAVRSTPLGANLTQPVTYAEGFMRGLEKPARAALGVPEDQPGLMSEALKINPLGPVAQGANVAREAVSNPVEFTKASVAEGVGLATAPANYAIPAALEASKLIPVGKTTLGRIMKLPPKKIKDAMAGKIPLEVQDRFIRMVDKLRPLQKHLPESVRNQTINEGFEYKRSGSPSVHPSSELTPFIDHLNKRLANPGASKVTDKILKSPKDYDEMTKYFFDNTFKKLSKSEQDYFNKLYNAYGSRDKKIELVLHAQRYAKKSPTVPPIKSPVASAQPSQPSPEDLTEKMLKELKAAKPMRREQEALYTQERTRKAGLLEEARKTLSGKQRFYAQKAILKGELPKASYEPIEGKFTSEQQDLLFDAINRHPAINEYENVSASNALEGMLRGKLPTEGELELLKKVFGQKLESVLEGKLPLPDRLWKYLIKTGNLSRGLMASFDMSMPFRQGIFLVSRPKQFFPAFKEMFKHFASEKALNQFQASLAQRPTFQLMKQAKLALTEMDGVLTKQEEQFMQANFAEAIPVIGKVVRASNRAAVGFLNKLRADTFDSLVNQARKEGVQVDDNYSFLHSLGDFINSATGRGNIKGAEKALPVMNATLFSPRLLMSRFNLLNPLYYMKQDPFVRKEALKTLAGTVGTLSTIMFLAKQAGAEVETDPTATDFGKIKIGNTRYDMGGGFLQFIRLYAQLIGGKMKTSTGKEIKFGEGYKPLTRLDVLARFAEYKTAPLLSLAVSLLRGKDAIGEDVNIKTLPKDIAKRYVPLVFQDLYDLYKDRGIEGLPMGIPAFFGIGTMTYKSKQNSNNMARKIQARMKARLRPRR